MGGRKGIRPVKIGGWWRLALLSPDGVEPSRMVGVSASVNLPLHHQVQKFSSGTGSPGWCRKKGCKTVVVYGGGVMWYGTPSMLWRCWLGVRKRMRPVKNLSDEVLAWLSVWSELQTICMWSSWCHFHPIISCFIKIQIGLTCLVPACPSCPGKRPLNGCLSVMRYGIALRQHCILTK